MGKIETRLMSKKMEEGNRDFATETGAREGENSAADFTADSQEYGY